MTIISTPQEYNEENLYVDLRSTLGRPLFLKCEGFNFAGSVKLTAAASMDAVAERDGLLHPGSVLVESSSGNLGVALSMIAASRGYHFVAKFTCQKNRCFRNPEIGWPLLGFVYAAQEAGILLGAEVGVEACAKFGMHCFEMTNDECLMTKE